MSADPRPKYPIFDLDTVFEVDDYMFVYRHDLSDERSEAEQEAAVIRTDWATAAVVTCFNLH